jgi:ribulose-phosphate 3-epimerase
MKDFLLAPSLLACDFGNLARDIAMINESRADLFHVDVMDGRFVPNISFGQEIVKVMGRLAKKPLDVHLMIEEPERYVSQFIQAGASYVTVHVEACKHLHRNIQEIKSLGAKAGVALNPHTPLTMIEDILEDIDMVLLMSVNPGFGGQKFIYNTIPKTKRLKTMIEERNLNCLIEIDGGVGLQNAEALLMAGADVLVAGNSIFASQDPIDTINKFKDLPKDTFLL